MVQSFMTDLMKLQRKKKTELGLQGTTIHVQGHLIFAKACKRVIYNEFC